MYERELFSVHLLCEMIYSLEAKKKQTEKPKEKVCDNFVTLFEKVI